MALLRRMSDKKGKSTLPDTAIDNKIQKLGETREIASEIYRCLDEVNHRFNMSRQSEKIKQACLTTMVTGEKTTLSGVEVINTIEIKVIAILKHLEDEVSADLAAVHKERFDAQLLYFAYQLRESLDLAYLYSAQVCFRTCFRHC